MNPFVKVKTLVVDELHGKHNYRLDFNPDINILHGINGSGKSTVLHILANILNFDFQLFTFLNFSHINLIFEDDTYIEIVKLVDDDADSEHIFLTGGKPQEQRGTCNFSKREAIECIKVLEERPYDSPLEVHEQRHDLEVRINKFCKGIGLHKIETSYFPAFRTMLEAWSSSITRTKFVDRKRMERFARRTFGGFVPQLNYPTPSIVERQLSSEYFRASFELSEKENEIFSDSFLRMFSKIGQENTKTKPISEIIDNINSFEKHSDNFLSSIDLAPSKINSMKEALKVRYEQSMENPQLSNALEVYSEALEEVNLEKYRLFSPINDYIGSVNYFLSGKTFRCFADVGINNDKTARKLSPSNIRVGFDTGDNKLCTAVSLSSGERQLLTMLWAVNNLDSDTVVLIDEPEISLHIDWQTDLIGEMTKQMDNCQLIICTHSPQIAADCESYMMEVEPLASRQEKE